MFHLLITLCHFSFLLLYLIFLVSHVLLCHILSDLVLTVVLLPSICITDLDLANHNTSLVLSSAGVVALEGDDHGTSKLFLPC